MKKETKKNQKKEDSKQSFNSIHKMKDGKGITLIALVVTIVILLILAGVSITAVFGENGLIEMARKAANATNEAIGAEQNNISELENFLGNHLAGGDTITPTPTVPGKIKIADLMKKSAEEQVSTENQDVEDAYGNPVTIPAGFRIVPNGEKYVTYTYTGDNIPTVQDGIVIEDAEGNEYGEKNQFVWIPVCTVEKQEENVVVTRGIKGKDGEISKKVILGRYTFNEEDKSGEEHLEQYGINYASEYGIEDNWYEGHYYQERTSKVDEKNEVARDLKKFVENTNEKGGYWFARYEAVKGTDEKVKSMESTKNIEQSSKEQKIESGMVWYNIKQPEASMAVKTMYSINDSFETDLVNSYAWDTAIVFIQTYSVENTKYSMQEPSGKKEVKTGEEGDGKKTDKACNIYNMADNLYEFSTETGDLSSSISYCSIARGGCSNYELGGDMVSTRHKFLTYGYLLNDIYTFYSSYLTFRPILYLTTNI